MTLPNPNKLMKIVETKKAKQLSKKGKSVSEISKALKRCDKTTNKRLEND